MANHASRGRVRRIQSRTKLFVCPTAFAAPAYRDPTILNDNDNDDEDGGSERANSSGGTLRRSEEKRKRPLSRNTKQPPTVPHHYSACRAQMLTTERIAVRHKEGVKINSFIRASHFSLSSRKRKKKRFSLR